MIILIFILRLRLKQTSYQSINNHLICLTVPTHKVSFFSLTMTLPKILKFENNYTQTLFSVSISISAQSLLLIDFGFFLITVPSLGLKIKLILVILAGDRLAPIYTTTCVPLKIGTSKSKANASTTNFLLTGIEYFKLDTTFPNLIVSKKVSSISLIWAYTLSPTLASFTFSFPTKMSLMIHWQF